MAGDITMGNPSVISSAVSTPELEGRSDMPLPAHDSNPEGLLFNSQMAHSESLISKTEESRGLEPFSQVFDAVETQFDYAGMHGVNNKPVEVFNSSHFSKANRLRAARENVAQMSSESASQHLPAQAMEAVSQPATVAPHADHDTARQIENLMMKIILEERKTHISAAGREQTMGKHTDQHSARNDKSLVTVLRRILKDTIGASSRSQSVEAPQGKQSIGFALMGQRTAKKMQKTVTNYNEMTLGE